MNRNYFAAAALLVFFYFAVYSLRPSISAGDTAELAASGAVLGVAHSPGYPLFTVAGKFFGTVMPFGNFGYRMNVSSAVKALAALFLLYLLLAKTGFPQAVVAVIFAAGSVIFWKEAAIAEVFSLNLLCGALLALAVFGDPDIARARPCTARRVYCVAFLYGLFLGNHHTLLLAFPMLAVYAYYKLKGLPAREIIRVVCVAALFFAAGISVYLYLPLRSLRQPLLDWEDPQTLERFWGVVARLRYGSLSLAQGESRALSLAHIREAVIFYFTVLAKNYNAAGIAVFAAGAVSSFFRGRRIFVLNSLFFVFTGPFMFIMANVPHNAHTEYIMERFFLLSLIPVSIFTAHGVDWILKSMSRKWAYALAGALAVFGIFEIRQRFEENKVYRSSLQVYDAGKNVLRHLSPKALLIADRADETEFALAFLFYAQGLRPDVEYVDANAGVTRSVYGDEYYKIWGKKRLMIRNIVEQRMINAREGAVYYATVLPEQTSTPKTPCGMLYISKGAPPDKAVWDEVLLPPRGGLAADEREIQMYSGFYRSLAGYYLKIADLPKALAYYKSYLSSAGQWRVLGVNAAYELHKQGYLQQAEELYKGVLARDKKNAQAWNNLGAIYNESGRLAQAKAAFESLISVDPKSAEGYYNLAIVKWKNGDTQGAVRELRQALSVKADYAEAAGFLNRLTGAGK